MSRFVLHTDCFLHCGGYIGYVRHFKDGRFPVNNTAKEAMRVKRKTAATFMSIANYSLHCTIKSYHAAVELNPSISMTESCTWLKSMPTITDDRTYISVKTLVDYFSDYCHMCLS